MAFIFASRAGMRTYCDSMRSDSARRAAWRLKATLITAAAAIFAASIGVKAAQEPGPVSAVSSVTPVPRTGEQIYRAACITCHGPDGRGNPRSHVGFDVTLPDFTDCTFASPEASADWFAIVHAGGPVRAFARQMPAFGGALSDDDIRRVVGFIRSLCTDRRWPPGDLNLPRALLTEKAFPENEAVFVASANRDNGAAVTTAAIYERRIGARSQWELAVPVAMQQSGDGGSWTQGLGDIAAAFKHVLFHDGGRGSIVSAGTEVGLPTGRRSTGAGKGTAIFEPFVAAGQSIGANGFVQAHSGIELPVDREKSEREAFIRIAAGQTFFQGRYNREWTPMLELIGAKALEPGTSMEWDVVPQMQLSLSRRHHVMLSAGVQIPAVERAGRGRTFHTYLLWDWFDGGFFSGW
jgi:mono/diheme cytochrome c family protein